MCYMDTFLFFLFLYYIQSKTLFYCRITHIEEKLTSLPGESLVKFDDDCFFFHSLYSECEHRRE
jgi:hypothetical protein